MKVLLAVSSSGSQTPPAALSLDNPSRPDVAMLTEI
jgi:hypothetical protein